MFNATLFTIAKIWKQPKCPSMIAWLKKMWLYKYIYMYRYIYTHIYIYNRILVIKKNETLPFVTTWMDLEGIMLIEISQRKTKTIWFNLYVEFEKQSKSTNITKQKQSHRFRVQIGGNQRDRKWAEDRNRWRLRYKFLVTK